MYNTNTNLTVQACSTLTHSTEAMCKRPFKSFIRDSLFLNIFLELFGKIEHKNMAVLGIAFFQYKLGSHYTVK